MAQYYQVVHNIDDLKKLYPNISLENVRFVPVADDAANNGGQLMLSSNDSLVVNQNQLQQFVYNAAAAPQQETIGTQVVEREEEVQTTLSQPQQQTQIYYTNEITTEESLLQQQQQIELQQQANELQMQQQVEHQQQQIVIRNIQQSQTNQILLQKQVEQPQQQLIMTQEQHQQLLLQQQQQQQQVHASSSVVVRQPQHRIIYNTQPRTVIYNPHAETYVNTSRMVRQTISSQQPQNSNQQNLIFQQQHEHQQQQQLLQEQQQQQQQFALIQQQDDQEMISQQFTAATVQETTSDDQLGTSQYTVLRQKKFVQTQNPQNVQVSTTGFVQQNMVRQNARGTARANATVPRTAVKNSPRFSTPPSTLNIDSGTATPELTIARTAQIPQYAPRGRGRGRGSGAGSRGGRGGCKQQVSGGIIRASTTTNSAVNNSAVPMTNSQQIQKVFAPLVSSTPKAQASPTTASLQRGQASAPKPPTQAVQKLNYATNISVATSTGQQTIQNPLKPCRTVNKQVRSINSTGAAVNNSAGFPVIDLEDSIQAAVVSKNSEPIVRNQSTNATYSSSESFEEDKRLIKCINGREMLLSDYKKLQYHQKANNMTTNRPAPPLVRTNAAMGNRQTMTPKTIVLNTSNQTQQQQPMSQQNNTAANQQQLKTASPPHGSFIIQAPTKTAPDSVEGENPRSAKMLVILQNGEQRLITFTLPRETCTVQELLEQVGVPFTPETNINCLPNPGANIDYVVTVGFTVTESASELISAAENTLMLNKQQGLNTFEQCVSDPGAESPEPPKDVQPKYIPGFFAVCTWCGGSSYDHAKCDRCKRIFAEEPKRQPVSMTKDQKLQQQQQSSSSSSDSQKRSIDIFNRLAANKALSTPGRGRPSLSVTVPGRGRGRGGVARTTKHDEPVILTLSSDEEDDSGDKSNDKFEKPAVPALNTTAKKTPLSCEPIIAEDNVNVTVQPRNIETRYQRKANEIVHIDDSSDEESSSFSLLGSGTDYVNRENIADCVDGDDNTIHTFLTCKIIRIGTLHYEPKEKVILSHKGIRIVSPNAKIPTDNIILNIQMRELVKLVFHHSKQLSVIFIYVTQSCANYVRDCLDMRDRNDSDWPFFNPLSTSDECGKRIFLQIEAFSDVNKSVIKSIFPTTTLEEVNYNDAKELLIRSCSKEKPATRSDSNSGKCESDNVRQILIYPPGTGGISINTEDYMCLAIDQYLNDIIIEFYLKYLQINMLDDEQRQKTHIFSSFFYKRLTTMTSRQRQTDKDVKLTAAQKRHARVRNWTKNVNLFEKDFIIIPINEQSHWFLAIVCFPGLRHPVDFETNEPVTAQQIIKKKRITSEKKQISLQIGSTTITPLSKREVDAVCIQDDESERDEAEGDDSDLESDESDADAGVSPSTSATINNDRPLTIKQPLILIFDSLSGASRSRVVATLRDYLTCEYRAKIRDGPGHSFTKANMQGHCVKVPQQDNFTDCGLFLLQYVEEFFRNSITDYRLPIKQLVNWFDTIVVTRKREEISNLIRDLVEQRNPDKLPLPEIAFPTINGKLIENDDSFNEEQAEFEEEEMEEECGEESEETAAESESSPIKIKTNNRNSNNSRNSVGGPSPSSTVRSAEETVLATIQTANTGKTIQQQRKEITFNKRLIGEDGRLCEIPIRKIARLDQSSPS